jgi:type VI secretion system protein ImpC
MSSEPAQLRIVVLGDLGGGPDVQGRRIPLDKQRFEEVFARVAPRLAFSVPNRLGGAAPQLDVVLPLARWQDLSPAGLVGVVPALARAREVRDLIDAVGKGELATAAFRERAAALVPGPLADALAQAFELAPAGPATLPGAAGAAPTAGTGVESILELVETGSAPKAGARETARKMLDAIAPRRSGAGGAGRDGAAAAGAALDAVLAAQLDEIVRAPGFRALEAAWRGVKLLVDRTDFRKPIAVELVQADRESAAAALDGLAEGEDVDLVLTAFELDASTRDLELAQALADAGERAQTPVAVGLAPGFLGLPSWRGVAKARLPQQTFDEAAYTGWRSLRGRDEARWLVLLANRVALRAPYGPDGEPARGVAYRESGDDSGLTGSAVFALGSVVTRSFARTGACLQISGSHHALVPDLPLLSPGPDGRPAPVEGVFGNERREDLERIGLAVLQVYQRDIAFLGSVRTFRKPEKYPDAEATADAAQQSTLAYQIFASRLVKFLGRAVGDLVGTTDTAAATHALRGSIIQFLSTTEAPLGPERVGIALKPSPKDATITDVALRVGPDLTIAGRPVNVLLNFSLRL